VSRAAARVFTTPTLAPPRVDAAALARDLRRAVRKVDGSAHGGHVLDARVWPTLELVLTESPRTLARRSDPATGLAFIDVSRRRAA